MSNGPSNPGSWPARFAPTDRTGSWVLDRFQLRRELQTSSAEAEIWLGRARDDRQQVAVTLYRGATAIQRGQREAVALGRIRHPGVAELVAHGPHEDGWCVVTAHRDGTTLAKMLQVTRPSTPRAVGWVRQLAEALAAAHAVGVVVRDVNPAHVLVSPDAAGREQLVLFGFGLAAVDGEHDAATGLAATTAPETIQGRRPDGATDVYALGCLMHRLLVDRYPFVGDDAAVFVSHVDADVGPLGQHHPALRLPAGLEALVVTALAKDAATRPSAQAFAAALGRLEYLPQRDWVRVTGFDLTLAPEDREVTKPVSGRPWLAGAALLLALCIAGLAALV